MTKRNRGGDTWDEYSTRGLAARAADFVPTYVDDGHDADPGVNEAEQIVRRALGKWAVLSGSSADTIFNAHPEGVFIGRDVLTDTSRIHLVAAGYGEIHHTWTAAEAEEIAREEAERSANKNGYYPAFPSEFGLWYNHDKPE